MADAQTTKEAIERLQRWRDVGDGPVTYAAGSLKFADDVTLALAEINRLQTELEATENGGLGIISAEGADGIRKQDGHIMS